MNLILAIIFFIALLSFIEVIKRFFCLSSEISRKVAHITSATAIFFLPYLLTKWQLVILAGGFVLLLSLSQRLNVLKSIHTVSRKTWGEIFLPAGAGIAALLFLPDNLVAFQFGILVMGIADSLGGIIGFRFGKHKISWLKNEKTWEGSIVFFITTFLIFIFYFTPAGYSILSGVMVAVLLTILEAVANRGLDNLFLPPIAGYLIMVVII